MSPRSLRSLRGLMVFAIPNVHYLLGHMTVSTQLTTDYAVSAAQRYFASIYRSGITDTNGINH